MVLAVIGVPIALALAVGGDVQPLSVQRAAAPAVVEPAPCCLQLVAADAAIAAPGGAVSVGFAPQASRASRWVVDTRSRFLPVGLAPEKGCRSRPFWCPAPSAPNSRRSTTWAGCVPMRCAGIPKGWPST